MRRPRLRAAAIATAMALAGLSGGCEAPPTREQGGMIIGGILGGVLGSQVGSGSGRTAATVLGTIAGAAIGGSVGRSMADTDRLKTAQALESGRTGESSRWLNPDTGHTYVVVPRRTWDQGGAPCREFTVDAIIGGNSEQAVGTACRQGDGHWRIQP